MVAVANSPLDYIREEAKSRPSYSAHLRQPAAAQSTAAWPRITKQDTVKGAKRTNSLRASQRSSDGQHFVSNVGSNGTLYLRPVSRVPPVPETTEWILPSDLDKVEETHVVDNSWELESTFSSPERHWTPRHAQIRHIAMSSAGSHLPSQSSPQDRAPPPVFNKSNLDSSQRANHSIKASIAPTHAVSTPPSAFQLLQVPIPHYRLGVPQFNRTGSAIIRDSISSSIMSGYDRSSMSSSRQDYHALFPEPPGVRAETPAVERQQATQQPKEQDLGLTLARSSSEQTITARSPHQGRPSQDNQWLKIQEGQAYTLPQPAQDRGMQRVSRTVEITGATPTGLMAQITSPSDYVVHFELLHDFFLTFRTYIPQSVLLDYLFARLEWSTRNDTDFARIVKVRVFVAIRHWLLNYFLEDFVLDRELRIQFCDHADSLCKKLRMSAAADGDRSICREVKKCYRDQLRLYWDMPRTLDPDAALLPGGELGSRDPMMNDSQAREKYAGKQSYESNVTRRQHYSALPENSTVGPYDTRPSVSTLPNEKVRPRHQYRNSDQSIDVSWCAMPKRALRKVSNAKPALGPRPVTPDMLTNYPSPQPVHQAPPLETPRRPFESAVSSASKGAKHLGSPSMGLGASPAPTGVSFTGSLVRGMGVQPMSPQVIVPSDLDMINSVAPSFVDPFDRSPTPAKGRKSSAASDRPSILGTMRRALSTRKPSVATVESRSWSRASGRRSATPTHMRSPTPVPSRPLEDMPRVDVLAAQLLESFERAIRGPSVGRNVSATSAVGENLAITQNSGIADVPAAIPEDVPQEELVESELATASNARDFAAGKITTPDMPEQKTVLETPNDDYARSRKHRHAISAESAFSEWSAGIRSSQAAITPLGEVLFKPSPETQHSFDMPMDMTSRFNDAPVLLEEDEDQMTRDHLDQPAQAEQTYIRDYHAFPYGLAPNMTTKSLDTDTITTDVTDTTTDPFGLERITNYNNLKRQPGGDLRAHGHVRSLLVPPHHESMYSLDNKSEVPSMSSTVDVDNSKSRDRHTSTFNMLTTHSSTQLANMDPEFVEAAANLAALPDEEDDGGIEATLRKLEGRFDGPEYEDMTEAEREEMMRRFNMDERSDSPQADQEELRRHREEEIDGNTVTEPPASEHLPAQESFTTGTTHPRTPGALSTRAESPADSMTSYSSTPLLERGADSLILPRPKVSPREARHAQAQYPSPREQHSSPTSPQDQSYVTAFEDEHHDIHSEGAEHSPEGSVIVRQAQAHTRNTPSKSTQRSYLLDPDESLSHLPVLAQEDEEDVGEEVYEHNRSASEMRNYYDDSSDHDVDVTPHPLAHPKTPPRMTDTIARQSSQAIIPTLAQVAPKQAPQSKTPRHIPLQDRVDQHARSSAANELRKMSDGIMRENTIHAPPPRPLFSSASNHYPFVLAYDAALLAQQFTIIEKDALSDITWRELVDHHWSQTEDPHRNWADYLKSFSDTPEELYTRGGIDICTTRFNLMVQWVTSEILLTSDLNERASCVTKFIQIAVECRSLRNWATAIQLTMALTNSRIQRLTRTWSLVLDHDRQALQSLDALILPARNFSNIRTEQDRYRIKADRANEDKKRGRNLPHLNNASGIGCIPWMALYTRDLVANAQKPEYLEGAVAVTADGVVLNIPMDDIRNEVRGGNAHWEDKGEEKVINVERMRTVAGIVRHFVDMKRASEEYVLRQVPELLSRCLWIAALKEEELDKRAKSLE